MVLLLGGIILFESCAPKVITRIMKSYPETAKAEQIRLFEINDTVPNSAEILGQIAVVDQGLSSNCRYDQVLLLAQKETAKNGGNALALTDHIRPSFWGSSCHQISGTMLFMNDTIINKQSPNPFLIAKEQEIVRRKKMETPTNTIHASVGYAFITSKFYLPEGASGNPKNGINWQVGYEWISKRGIGAGIIYSGYKSSFNDSGTNFNLYLQYIAPEFLLKQKVSEKLMVRESLGIGYFNYTEKAANNYGYTMRGIGAHVNLGLEYLLTKHIGIGANLGIISANFGKNNQEYNYPENESIGIARIVLDAGARFYF